MMNAKRHIKKLMLPALGLMLAGCSEEILPGLASGGSDGEGNVTLTINVSIANSGTAGRTRDGEFSFDKTENPYELINTLRIIIVREDNTVEWNRLVTAPVNTDLTQTGVRETGVREMGELQFQVSTTEGEIDLAADTRTEKKRIYLIANEASIPANPDGINQVELLENLKSGYYREVPKVDENSDEFKNLSKDEQWAIRWDRKLYVPGDKFTPETAESMIIFNAWPNGANGASPEIAVPYLDNQGEVKKFVPMTEFFEISVTEDLKLATNINQKQKEDFFITRNLVKFRFSIIANPDPTDIEKTTSFKVTAITFNSLMQEEYLFPNETKYFPPKYESATDNERQITEFETPGFADKNICPYIFKPQNFVYDGNGEIAYYDPELYFCETQILKKDEFTVGIDVEFPFNEEVKDADGNPVTQPVTRHFEAKAPLDNLPYFIPRNTVVDVKMTLTNGELSAVATVLPYTAVSLNPEFGFSRPSTDELTVAERMYLSMDQKGLLYAYYTPTPTFIPPTEENPDPAQFKLIWVSSDTSIILLEPDGNDYDNPNDLRYVQPAETIELPYLNEDGSVHGDDGRSVPVRIIPVAPGNAEVVVYSQTGLVARCKVTVTEKPVTE